MNYKYVGLYTGSLSGHRESYLKFASKTLNGKRIFKKDMFFNKNPILFLMIEDSFFLFLIASVYRSILGWKTAGLLFRPKPAVEGKSFRLVLKRNLLRLLKTIPNISILLIIPNILNKKFEKISNGWIYDFQFWDVSDEEYKLFEEYKNNKTNHDLVKEIFDISNSRKIVTAIGSQNHHKGFDIFLNQYLKNSDLRKKYLFSFGGKSSQIFKDNIKLFENNNGFSLDRFISDKELLKLYATSDLIWALYSEEYDQASGIFGRSIQFGIPVIVRKNSLIHQMSVQENIKYVALDKNELSILLDIQIEKVNLSEGKRNRDSFKNRSVDQLRVALGLDNE